MKHLPLLLPACLVLAGCAEHRVPHRSEQQQSGPDSAGNETAESVSTITAEQARQIAIREMKVRDQDTRYVRVSPLELQRPSPVWHVWYSHPIAGAWVMRIDARTGSIVEKQILPSR